MKYEEILQELEEVGLNEKFTSDFENNASKGLLKKLKETNKINSTGSLIRHLIHCFEFKSENWEYWQKVLIYFMTPDFVKDKNKLPL